MDGEDGLQEEIRELAGQARRRLTAHPRPEDLLAYQAGDLPDEEADRIQEHLALCSECVRTVRDLSSFPDVEPAREEDRLSEDELAAAWTRLRQAVAPSTRRRRRFLSLTGLAFAASLLVVLGLAFQVVRLQKSVRELSIPRADVQIADLVPGGEIRERSGEEETIRLEPWAERILLILNLADARHYPQHRIDVATADGAVVWSRAGVYRDAGGIVAVELPKRLLPAGGYRIRLYGLGDGAPEPIAEYRFRIEPL